MGQHKGKKYKDRPCKQRYWAQLHLRANKIRRITRCNGEAFLAGWMRQFDRR